MVHSRWSMVHGVMRGKGVRGYGRWRGAMADGIVCAGKRGRKAGECNWLAVRRCLFAMENCGRGYAATAHQAVDHGPWTPVNNFRLP